MSKKFSPFCQNNAAWQPKLHSACLQEQFEPKIFLENKSWVFSIFFGFWAKKILAFYQFFFRKSYQKCLLRVHGNTSTQTVFYKFLYDFNSFSDYDWKKFGFPASFLRQVWKTAFYVCVDFFWGEVFKKNFLRHFWTTSKNFPVVRTVFYVPEEHFIVVFWKKWIFFNITVKWAKFSSFLSKDFQQDCQSRDVRFHKKIRRKTFYWKNCMCSILFQKWAKKFWPSGETFSAGLWKLLLMCP